MAMTKIFLMTFMISLMVVTLGGSQYQIVKAEFLNSYISLDGGEYKLSDEARFLQEGETDVDPATTSLGFIDGLRLVFDFLKNVLVNAIALPVTLMTVGNTPSAFAILFGFPIAIVYILQLVYLVRGVFG